MLGCPVASARRRQLQARSQAAERRLVERDRTFVDLREIGDDREAAPGPRRRFVGFDAALQDLLSSLRREPAPVVVYIDHDHRWTILIVSSTPASTPRRPAPSTSTKASASTRLHSRTSYALPWH